MNGDIYVSVESYYWEMIPHFNNCMIDSPKKMVTVFINDKMVKSYYESDAYNLPIIIESSSYIGNARMRIEIEFMWN